MHPALRQAIQKRGDECNGESFYRDLFAEAPIACFPVGVDGRIRAANRQALGLVVTDCPKSWDERCWTCMLTRLRERPKQKNNFSGSALARRFAPQS